ncbi:MAG: hypothetical protein Alpg2KO_21930 [Alphaproteobacteria bacterium]
MSDKTPPKSNLPATVTDSVKNRLWRIYTAEASYREIGEAVIKSPWYLLKGVIDAGKLGVNKMRGTKVPRITGGAAPASRSMKVDLSQREAFETTLPQGTYGIFRSNGERVIAGNDENIVLVALDEKRDMSRTLLAQMAIHGGNFGGLTADDVDLRQAELAKCSFEGARAHRGDFREATITDGTFAGADLRDADFSGTKIVATDPVNGRVSFKGAKLDGMKISETTRFEGADFSEADVSKVVILDDQGRTIPGAKLSTRGTVIYDNLEAMFQREDADARGQRALPAPAEEVALPDDERKILEEYRARKKAEAADAETKLRDEIIASLPEGLADDERELLIKRRLEAATAQKSEKEAAAPAIEAPAPVAETAKVEGPADDEPKKDDGGTDPVIRL